MGSIRLSAIVAVLVVVQQHCAASKTTKATWSFPSAFAEAVEKARVVDSHRTVRAHAFLQPAGKRSAQLQRQSAKVAGPSEQLAAQLTQQVALGAQHLDELLSECEAFRRAKQAEIERLIGEVTQISAGMAENSAEENEASNTLSQAKQQAFKLYDEVDEGRARCASEAEKNRVQTKELYDQILFAKKLLDTDCETLKSAKASGTAAFLQQDVAQNATARQVVQKFLRGVLLQADRSHDKQPVIARVRNRPALENPGCGVCEIPMDQVPCSQIYTDIRAAIARLRHHYSMATDAAREEEENCKRDEKGREEAMTLSRSQNAGANADVASVMSALADLKAARDGKLAEQAKAQQELESHNHECQLDQETLEAEIADAIRARQANYEREGGSPEALIIDCKVSDWLFGECSQSCAKTPGSFGWMTGVRSVQMEQTNGGMACPALETRQKCGTTPCPIDCTVTEWAPWTKCNKGCGGGTQTRTRQVRTPSAHGGLVCPATTERRSCNMQSCDKDCELADWSAWSTCSRVCRFSETSPAGRQHRKREVISEATAEGSCPAGDSDARLHEQDCNTELCPANFTCTPDNQDVVVMIDGSVSGDFEAGLAVTRELVKRAGNSTRFGLTVYGNKASAISPLTQDKEALFSALDKAAQKGPPKGETDVAGGLALVKTMLVAECSQFPRTRRETVLLLTDGSPLSFESAETMARRLEKQGVRIMLGFAHQGHKADAQRNACGLATPPYAENVEVFETWKEMAAEPERLVTALCHGLQAPAEGPVGAAIA